MGDRGNIVVEVQGETNLYLYTHWSGSELPWIVARGLERGKERWGDSQYLPRVLFCELVPQLDWKECTGYGISTSQGDGGTEVYVDITNQEVRFESSKLSFQSFVDRWKL